MIWRLHHRHQPQQLYIQQIIRQLIWSQAKMVIVKIIRKQIQMINPIEFK